VIAALIGLAGLTLALLYGLNVIGGSNTQKVAVAVNPQRSSAATTSTTTIKSPTSASTSSTTPTSNSATTTTNTGSTSTVASSTSTPIQPSSIPPASIPAVPVTTASHFYTGINLFDIGDGNFRGDSNG